MLDHKFLKANLTIVCDNLQKRKFYFDVKKFQQLEQQRKHYQVQVEQLRAKRNAHARAVALAKAQKQNDSAFMNETNQLSQQLKSQQQHLAKVQEQLQALLLGMPNLLHDSVPIGDNDDDNVEIKRWGEPRSWHFAPKDHVDLGARHGWIDFASAAKLAGARFVVLRGAMARLHRAIAQFMLDLHSQEHGYQEIYVPYMVNHQALYGTGQLPKFMDELFHVKGEQNYALISTAEIPVTNLLSNTIIDTKTLPIKYVCHTPCFRSEAGSYGRDTRGMIRQHQFEKVELIQVVEPKHSLQALEQLTQHAEMVLKKLHLPYRVMALCAGDMGFAATKTYDIEVFLPGQKCYREISSCSLCGDFQARRMKIRYRSHDAKTAFVHTLNGSGLAVGRTLVAIVENYQDEKGNIHIPQVLQPYMQNKRILT